MAKDPDSPKFNNDLLANDKDYKEDHDLAASIYPRLIHVLDHPALRQLFARYDASANAAKMWSRRWGFLAIGLGTFALLIASFASRPDDPAEYPKWLGLVSAVAGILSVVFGLWGVLYGKAKQRWLCQRLMTERFRQFHFQTFVSRLPEIVASLVPTNDAEAYQEAREAYEKARARWLNEFKARYEGHLDAELTEILDGRRVSDVWFHEPTQPDPSVLQADLREVFAAYRALRITHQLQYANYKLRADGSLWPPSLKRQGEILSQAAFVLVLALFLIHIAIAIGLSTPYLETVAAFVHKPGVHVAAIWCAIFALAVRAVEDGLGVRDETERYRDYRSSVKAIRKRFDQADPAEKLRVMKDMERLSYEEMCSFLRNAHDKRFIM